MPILASTSACARACEKASGVPVEKARGDRYASLHKAIGGIYLTVKVLSARLQRIVENWTGGKNVDRLGINFE